MKRIITISREFCSGGRVIGKMLAEKIGYKFYDSELLQIIADEQKLNVNFLEEVGEYKRSRFFPSINFADPYSGNLSIADQVYILQYNLIKELADKDNCVIIGRAADYILRDRTDTLSVFVYSSLEKKIPRAQELGITENYEKILAKKDKARANHYNYYTDRDWNLPSNYDIWLDSGELGYDNCVDVIEMLVKKL